MALAGIITGLLARGLPPEAVAIATRRLAAINAAWDRISRELAIP